MIDVLFISGSQPPVSVFADAVRRLNAEGARVVYAGSVPESYVNEELAGVELAETHLLTRTNLRRAVTLPFGERVWLRSRKDPWLIAHARTADVIVALDDGAIYTVWQLAQRNRTARAVHGFAPAITAVRELNAQGGAPDPGPFGPPMSLAAREFGRAVRRLPAAAARVLTAKPLMRRNLGAKLWRIPLRAPGVPDRLRVATGLRVHEAMNWAGKHSGGTYALALTASKISDSLTRAELLDKAVSQEIKRGTSFKHVDAAIEAMLAYADERHAAGDYAETAKWVKKALANGFHRAIHIDQLSSPLAEDPEGFTAPFHRSRAMRAITAPRGRLRPAAPAPTDRPLRLLVVTSANDTFLGDILDRYRRHPGVEVRFLDLTTQQSLKRVSWADREALRERMGDEPEYAALVEDLMRPHLDWADTLFLDWCTGPAAMLTTIDPGDTRIIVRLHSYELFTRWPHLVDFSRVDDLVFVGDHLRDLASQVVPRLRGSQAPRTPLVFNAVHLGGFAREKTPDARFTLGLVGVGQVVKDPRWAIQVLNLLREEDERYRLIMVGADMDPKFSAPTRIYRRRMERELAPLVEAGAVLRPGPTDDVAGKLVDIGFILSTSVRESAHLGLMEGAASGAVPVVRDWPFFAGKERSARTVFPQDWVVSTPEEAAARILRINASEESWRDHGKLAGEHAMATWDWSVVCADTDRLLFEY